VPIFGKTGLQTLGIILISLTLRLSLLSNETNDYRNFVGPWYDYIHNHGGFWALGDNFSNYTPPYLYLLVVATALPFPKLIAIKLLTFPFEGLCGFWLYRLLRLHYPQGPWPRLGALTFSFAPTVVLNGAYWGQCDILYTTWLVGCLYALSLGHQVGAMICFGLAIAFKQQALWFLPVLVMLGIKRQFSWWNLAGVPLVYGLVMVPAWLAGRPWSDLLTIYFQQVNTYRLLTLNAPNLYQWLSTAEYSIFFPLGLVFTLSVVLTLMARGLPTRQPINPGQLLQLSLIFLVLLPYCLPKMHDRYFFAADVFAVIYSFRFPLYFWVGLAMNGISLLAYFPFLVGLEIVPLKMVSILLAGVIFGLLYHYQQGLGQEP
jgi:Gpi18-like mannosyltransferase